MKNVGSVSVQEATAILDVELNMIRAWGANGTITEYRHPTNNYRLFKFQTGATIFESTTSRFSVFDTVEEK